MFRGQKDLIILYYAEEDNGRVRSPLSINIFYIFLFFNV